MNTDQFKLTRQEIKNARKPRDCQNCGACCRSFAIELSIEDVKRESLLLAYAVSTDTIDPRRRQRFHESPFVMLLQGGNCPFLTPNSLCRIHPTRPTVCRRWVPNLLHCHTSRLEECGIDMMDFVGKTCNLPASVAMGIAFSLNPALLQRSPIIPGSPPTEISVIELIDLDYLKSFRELYLKDET